MKPIIRSENTAYTCRLFTVKNIETELPDGKKKTFEMIDIQSAVTVLPMDDEQNVYFVEQYRIGSRKTLLELPAGKVESGEDPLATAKRELREETGMDAKEIRPLGNFYMTPGYANEYMYCFLAKGLFPSPLTPDADEFINLRKVPLKKIGELIRKGEIEDSKSLAAFQLYHIHFEVSS